MRHHTFGLGSVAAEPIHVKTKNGLFGAFSVHTRAQLVWDGKDRIYKPLQAFGNSEHDAMSNLQRKFKDLAVGTVIRSLYQRCYFEKIDERTWRELSKLERPKSRTSIAAPMIYGRQ